MYPVVVTALPDALSLVSVEKSPMHLWIEDRPRGRPRETPPSRARLAFPESLTAAFGGGLVFPQPAYATAYFTIVRLRAAETS